MKLFLVTVILPLLVYAQIPAGYKQVVNPLGNALYIGAITFAILDDNMNSGNKNLQIPIAVKAGFIKADKGHFYYKFQGVVLTQSNCTLSDDLQPNPHCVSVPNGSTKTCDFDVYKEVQINKFTMTKRCS